MQYRIWEPERTSAAASRFMARVTYQGNSCYCNGNTHAEVFAKLLTRAAYLHCIARERKAREVAA